MSAPEGGFSGAAAASAWSLASSAALYSAMLRSRAAIRSCNRFSVRMLALLASPWKNAPSIATSAPPSRSRLPASRTKSRFAAFSPAALSLRKLAIVR